MGAAFDRFLDAAGYGVSPGARNPTTRMGISRTPGATPRIP